MVRQAWVGARAEWLHGGGPEWSGPLRLQRDRPLVTVTNGAEYRAPSYLDEWGLATPAMGNVPITSA